MITTLWCGRGDLNPQAFRRRILSPLCMPFHHVHLEIFVSLEAGSIIHTCRYFVKCFFAKMYPFLKYISSKIFFGALDSALRPLNHRRLRPTTPLPQHSYFFLIKLYLIKHFGPRTLKPTGSNRYSIKITRHQRRHAPP